MIVQQRRHQKIISFVGRSNNMVDNELQSTTTSIVQKRIVLLLLAAAAISSCNAFSPPLAITSTMYRRGCNNDDDVRGTNNMRGETTRSKVVMLMAQRMTPTRKTRKDDSFDRESGKEENEEKDDLPLDFSEAQAKIKEDENRRRVEEGLTVGLTKEDEDEFNAKKDAYEDMRSKIRARASQEGFEKSVATKKAIEEATQRAMAGQSSATPDQMLDLSGFADKFVDDGTDELTDEEQAEIDKIANMPLWEQAKEELSNTRFPTPIAIFQTACVMALIFAVSATLILKGDATIRDFYMDLGFIPRPDEVYDFSDLDLPDGFLEQADLEGNLGDQAEKIADAFLPSSSSSSQ